MSLKSSNLAVNKSLSTSYHHPGQALLFISFLSSFHFLRMGFESSLKMGWVRGTIIAILRTCVRWLSVDPEDEITRVPINQDTNTDDNTRPAKDNNTNNTVGVTSPADDAFGSSIDLTDHLLRPIHQNSSQNLTMAANAASYINQGALQ